MATDGYLCHNCTEDAFLKRRIQRQCGAHVCSGCGKKRKAIAIETFVTELDEVVRANFERVFPYNEWDVGGDDLNFIIQEVVSTGPEVADLLIEALGETEDTYHIVKDGGEPFYDDTAEYRQPPAYDGDFRSTWRDFCHNVKHTARFFSDSAEDRLHEIFSNLDRFQGRNGQKPIKILSPEEKGIEIHRARIAEKAVDALPMVTSPASKLGSPPEALAVPMRMNPAGIAVFYGALDIETCISEVRPPVGALVVAARFSLLRPVRVLDLTVLDEAYAELSYFQPEFEQVTEQLAFLHSFHAEISSPVLPSDQSLAFIPTQVVAEFLAHRYDPKLDGVLYASTQIAAVESLDEDGNPKPKTLRGLNLVLFHQASMVEGAENERKEETDQVNSSITCELSIDDSESFVISKPHKPATDSTEPAGKYQAMPVEFEMKLSRPQADIVREPTIKVEAGSVTMLRVTGTQYTHEDIRIVDIRGFRPDGGMADASEIFDEIV